MSLKRAILAFCHYRAFGKGKRGGKKKKNQTQNCSLGLCECPGKKRGGQPPFTWEEDENHQNSPYFSLPRHKVRASRNTSEDKSRNSSSDTSLSLHNFIKHYKQGFVSACMKISSCLFFLCTNRFFGKKQSQEGTRPRQRASSLSQCLPVGLGPGFCPIYALQCILPFVFKSDDVGVWFSAVLIISECCNCRKWGYPKEL